MVGSAEEQVAETGSSGFTPTVYTGHAETRSGLRTLDLAGARAAQASRLGNLSYVQKRRIDFDPVREKILPF